MASSGLGPSRLSGGSVSPTWTAWNDEPVRPLIPMTRSSQPDRAEVPGAARSISACASKCDRSGAQRPQA